MELYDTIGKKYSDLITADPIKKYAQYLSVLEFIGSVDGKRVLDIGCGDGVLSRALSKKGAAVLGFDVSEQQINLAKKLSEGFGIEYEVNSPQVFEKTVLFDKAIAVMVLPYAKDYADLKSFFDCAYSSLKQGGVFLSLVFMPQSIHFQKMTANRTFTDLGNKKVKVEFLDKTHNDSFFATVNNFTKEEYEKSSKEVGFKELVWKNLIIGKNDLPEDFWQIFKETNPYKIFIATK